MYDLINSLNDLTNSMADLVASATPNRSIPRSPSPWDKGSHVLGVGIRSNASGCATGSGFALMGGQIQNVTLDISNEYSGAPDLTILDIDPSDAYPQRGRQVTFLVGVNNVGKGVAESDKVRLVIDERANRPPSLNPPKAALVLNPPPPPYDLWIHSVGQRQYDPDGHGRPR